TSVAVPWNVDLLTVRGGAPDRPVHDEQGDVVGDVDVTGLDLDGKPKGRHAGIRLATVGPGRRLPRAVDEDATCFVDALDCVGIAGVERGREDVRLLFRAGGQREVAAGWKNLIGHGHSEAGDLVAHQTVRIRWDEELVPTPTGRTQAPSPDCPVEVALAAIAGRWTTLVLRNLMSGDAYSYTELAASLPSLSDKVLSDRLNALVSGGLVERTINNGFPPRTEYRITDR